MTVPKQVLQQSQQMRLQMLLAPQLRQSLEVLQVPTLELQSLVQQELEQNPTLEEIVQALRPVEIEPGDSAENEDERIANDELRVLKKLDEEWREYFALTQSAGRERSPLEQQERHDFFISSLTEPETLHDHLMAQLPFAGLDAVRRGLAELLIGQISPDGYCTMSLDELAESTGADPALLRAVLEVIQNMDPVGVGARDVRECLLLQLSRLGKTSSLAVRLVADHLPDLAAHRYQELARDLGRTGAEVRAAAQFIATLEPRPGRAFSSGPTQYVLPDVAVMRAEDGGYQVRMNDEHVPHVRISRHYRALLEAAETTPEVRTYVRDKIRAGAMLIKSLHQRQRTIYRIACEIVAIQREFLDAGVQALKPLTMARIAESLELHETTISPAIANKYMQTPQGLFEMKYFFTPGIRTAGGGEVSNKMVHERIRQLVAAEDASKPLSDQELAARLAAEGLRIARRTVAKYREVLRIPPSPMRRG